ncbi:MAG: ABC transporter permease [Candidatus Methanoplasma sp.]|jgi:NitT/TauT family transport system permease protein|nr:ABC transporter permease [Candidatus Methanoplasma sp.]
MVMRIQGLKYDENNWIHRQVRLAAITVVAIAAFVAAWHVASVLADTPTVPSPGRTLDALINFYSYGDWSSGTQRTMFELIGSSMITFAKGFALALVVAVPLGLALGYFKIAREFTNPIIEVLRPIAPIAWAPIFIIILGSATGAMLVVFIGIFFPLLTNVIFGVRKIEANLLDASKTLGASQFQVFYKVIMPYTAPYLMNGVKVGLGVGWMCIVAAEMCAGTLVGVGKYLYDMAYSGNWPKAYAALVLIGVLGLLTIGVSDYVHRWVSRRMGMDA